MMHEYFNYVLAFVDTLPLVRSKVPRLASFKQDLLAKYFFHEAHYAHNAVDDVNIITKIVRAIGMEKPDYVKH